MWGVQDGPLPVHKSGYNSTWGGYNHSYPFIRPFIRFVTPFRTDRGSSCGKRSIHDLLEGSTKSPCFEEFCVFFFVMAWPSKREIFELFKQLGIREIVLWWGRGWDKSRYKGSNHP